MSTKVQKRERRVARIRAKVKGTSARPRLVVSRSLKHIYAQLVDDTTGKTIASVSDVATKEKSTKTQRAATVGAALGKKAQEKGITEVVFDRNGNKYHGRTKAVAEAARESGLKF